MLLFKDTARQEDFDKNGFHYIPEFMSMKSINKMKDFFEEIKPGFHIDRMYSPMEDMDVDLSHRVETFLTEMYQPGRDKYFENYRIAGSTFLLKGPGKNSDSRLHQDFNIVNESKFRSCAIWVPMQDVDEHNGCLIAIPGSHKWKKTIRSASFESLHLKYTKRLNKHIVPIPAKAGDAIVYMLGVWHGSWPNYSDKVRKCSVLSLTEKDAQPIHYFWDNKEDKVYEVLGDNEFMYSMYFKLENRISVPLGDVKVIEQLDNYKSYVMGKDEFYSFVEDKKPFMSGIKSFFGS